MHFLQTFISNLQPIDDFPLDLSKLQVLNLEPEAKRGTVKTVLFNEGPGRGSVAHHALQVADLVLGLVEELILVALLLQEEESFAVWRETQEKQSC